MTPKTILLTLLTLSGLAGMAQKAQNIIARGSDSPEVPAAAINIYSKGAELSNRGEYAKAIPFYEQALRIDSNYIDAYNNLGLCFYETDSYDSAAWYLQISLRKAPKSLAALTNMSLVEQKREHLPEALVYTKQIIALEPNNPEGYYNTASILLAMAKFDESLVQAQQAEKLYAKAHSSQLGDCYLLELIIYFNMGNKAMCQKYRALCKKENVTVPTELAADPN